MQQSWKFGGRENSQTRETLSKFINDELWPVSLQFGILVY